MQPLDTISAEDAGALQMENELLRYEVTHLRAKLAAHQERERRPDQAGNRRGAARKRPTRQGPSRPKPARKDSAAEPIGRGDEVATRNQLAYDDVRWLVRRLDGSPVAPALRRFRGFRVMVERYGSAR